MPNTKRKIERTKLFRMVQNFDEFDCKFRPTIADCREVFRNINKQVFNNELTMPNFRLVYSGKFWGECQGNIDDNERCIIRMNKSFLSKRLFVYTMAHEMVHQWEWLVHEHMTHGPTFFIWREELSKFGIVLSRKYRIKHYKLN
jgi:hypothetical protein